MNLSWLPALDSVAMHVVHATWQASVLAAIVLLVSFCCRRRLDSRWRFGLWLVVFARLALPVLPGASWSVFQWLPHDTPSSMEAPEPPVATRRIESPSRPASDFGSRTVAADDLGRRSAVAQQSAAVQPSEPVQAISWFDRLALLWVVGVVLLVARLGWMAIRLHQQQRSWPVVTDPAVLALLERCRKELCCRRSVSLRTSTTNIGPATWGVMRCCIIIPHEFLATISLEDLRLLLLHELIHVRRLDLLMDRTASVIAAVHWFNPVAWIALACLRRERELACDAGLLDRVSSDAAYQYGHLILRIVKTMAPHAAPPATVGIWGWNTQASLQRRIHMIAAHRKPDLLGTTLAATLLCLLVVGGLTDARSEPPAPASPKAESHNQQQSDITAKPAAEKQADAPRITISGTCLDESQKPIAGARLRLFLVDYSKAVDFAAPGSQEQLQDLRTDSRGRFRFAAVGRELDNKYAHLIVVAQSPRKATVSWRIGPEATSDVARELKMLVAATLKGRVTDADGKPVAGAVVGPGCGLPEPVPGIGSAVTDADGKYQIADLRPWDATKQKPQPAGEGRYWITGGCNGTVLHPDYARQTFLYTRIPSTIDVTLQRRAAVAGQVVLAESGEPAANVRLEFSNDVIGPDWWTRATTDAQGHFRLNTLPPGQYKLTARLDGRPVHEVPVELKVGKNSLDLWMERGGIIKGRVIDITTKQPVVLAAREIVQISTAVHEERYTRSGPNFANVERDGTFTLLVPPGTNYFGVYMESKWRGVNTDRLFEKGLDVADGQTVELEVRVRPRTEEEDGPPRAVAPSQAALLAEQAAIAAITKLGGWVKTEMIDGEEHVVELNMDFHESEDEGRLNNRLMTDESLFYAPKFPKLRKLFLHGAQASDRGLANVRGMDALEEIFLWDAAEVTDDGVTHLATLANLQFILLTNSKITDEALRHLSRTPKLNHLSLQTNRFTDRGLEHLKGMANLRKLSVGWTGEGKNTRITDDGLRNLVGLTGLELLDVQGTAISDAGLAHLRGLTNLRDLWLSGTSVTKPGVDKLLQAIPNLKPTGYPGEPAP